jgi:hypothetical protein
MKLRAIVGGMRFKRVEVDVAATPASRSKRSVE